MATILMVPGFTGSSPGHWQSLWEHNNPEYRRVQQHDWDHPDPVEWTAALDRAVTAAPAPIVLVGHSLGCTTIVRWATTHPTDRVAAALLVAPSDVEAPTSPAEVRSFAPIPTRQLPFPAIVVASTDDPMVTLPRATQMAASWGARLISIGVAGHIHTAAGYGPWPEGHIILTQLTDSIALRRLTSA